MTQADEFNLTIEQEAAWIRDHLDHPEKLILVAEIETQVIGIVNFQNGHRRRNAHACEFGMGVVNEWRGQGIGAELLRTLLRWAESNPTVEKACLTVHATNDRAIHVYKKLGFKEEGRRVRDLKYGKDSYVDSVLMYTFVK